VEVAILLGNVMVETMMFDVESRKVFRRLVAGLAASLAWYCKYEKATP
jgi:hypothetical protein